MDARELETVARAAPHVQLGEVRAELEESVLAGKEARLTGSDRDAAVLDRNLLAESTCHVDVKRPRRSENELVTGVLDREVAVFQFREADIRRGLARDDCAERGEGECRCRERECAVYPPLYFESLPPSGTEGRRSTIRS
jgi:hypothetical protein